MTQVAMLVLASGRGTRFSSQVPKVYVPIRGECALERSVRRLAEVTMDREIVLAAHPDDQATHLAPLLPRLQALGVTRVVAGGETRQHSMQNALAAASPGCDLVLVHDAARPFFPIGATRALLERARAVGGALLAVEAKDTLKRTAEDRRVLATLDRRGVWQAQTPQAARRGLLEKALAKALADGFAGTDEASLLEHAGFPVEVVPGEPTNLKLTTPADLAIAEALAELEARGELRETRGAT